MNATSDTGSDAVTVTCQASLQELRAAALWLYIHDRKSQIAILLTMVLPAILIFWVSDQVAHHWSGFINARYNYVTYRGVGSMVWVAGYIIHRAWLLWTLPARAWRRFQAAGPTTLTVSSTGLSWYNSQQRKEVGWDQYVGYAVLPELLIFLAKVPYIVPRSTVSPIDFEHVLTIAKRQLRAVSGSYWP